MGPADKFVACGSNLREVSFSYLYYSESKPIFYDPYSFGSFYDPFRPLPIHDFYEIYVLTYVKSRYFVPMSLQEKKKKIPKFVLGFKNIDILYSLNFRSSEAKKVTSHLLAFTKF